MGRTADRQRAVYEYIISATARQGYPPSVREIAQAVGLRSPSTVHGYLKRLHEEGLIVKDDRKTRAISVTQERGSEGVPIIGEIAAGRPIAAYEQALGTLPYQPGGAGTFFALVVNGDSMTGAGILDGDYVVVCQQPTARHGEIVAAMIDGEATVKRLHLQDGAVWLLPENPDYDPIDGSECRILGLVTAVVREL
jgi:repressor LexA